MITISKILYKIYNILYFLNHKKYLTISLKLKHIILTLNLEGNYCFFSDN